MGFEPISGAAQISPRRADANSAGEIWAGEIDTVDAGCGSFVDGDAGEMEAVAFGYSGGARLDQCGQDAYRDAYFPCKLERTAGGFPGLSGVLFPPHGFCAHVVEQLSHCW